MQACGVPLQELDDSFIPLVKVARGYTCRMNPNPKLADAAGEKFEMFSDMQTSANSTAMEEFWCKELISGPRRVPRSPEPVLPEPSLGQLGHHGRFLVVHVPIPAPPPRGLVVRTRPSRDYHTGRT